MRGSGPEPTMAQKPVKWSDASDTFSVRSLTIYGASTGNPKRLKNLLRCQVLLILTASFLEKTSTCVVGMFLISFLVSRISFVYFFVFPFFHPRKT